MGLAVQLTVLPTTMEVVALRIVMAQTVHTQTVPVTAMGQLVLATAMEVEAQLTVPATI
jgi:hypothetical protein